MADNEQRKDRGRLQFLTITASRYDIDFDAGLLRRTTGPPVDPQWPSAALRQDGEVVTLVAADGPFTIGSEVVLTIQLPDRVGVTYRRPTPIVQVEWVREPQRPQTELPSDNSCPRGNPVIG